MRRPQLASISLIVFLILGCSDVVEKHEVLKDADRPFLRGWLPNIVPLESTDVIMRNDLDTNTSSGSFTLPREDVQDFMDQLSNEGGDLVYTLGDSTWIFRVNRSTRRVEYVLE